MSEPSKRRGRGKDAGGTTTADRVLKLAAQQFRENGYHRTTTRELAAALGIEKASLYYHVPSKHDLLLRISHKSLTAIRAAVEQTLDGVEDPRERVKCLIRGHVGAMLRDRDLHATMLIELRALDAPGRDEVIAMRDDYEALVRGVLAQAQETGVLTDELTIRELGLSLLNLMNWSIFWFSPDGEDDPDRIAAVFERIFLHGASRA